MRGKKINEFAKRENELHGTGGTKGLQVFAARSYETRDAERHSSSLLREECFRLDEREEIGVRKAELLGVYFFRDKCAFVFVNNFDENSQQLFRLIEFDERVYNRSEQTFL